MHSLQYIFWGGINVGLGPMSNMCCHQGQDKPVFAQGKGTNLDFVPNVVSCNA